MPIVAAQSRVPVLAPFTGQTREGKLDQALAVLEQAIKVDPYAEELYRRGMRLLAQLRRGDAARRLLRQLEARLSELDA
jgi:DNA-binding SARP family transcriptional activator